jgi:hypothetical protein
MTTMLQRIETITAFASIHEKVSPEEWSGQLRRICRAFQWDGDLGDERMMTWRELESVRRCPWITIGGHTVSHPFLPR